MTLRILATILLCAALLPAPAVAHQQLLSARPTQGASLAAVPGELRLTFNQAVRTALAELRLRGPAGEVALGELVVAPDAPKVLTAAVVGGLTPGEYVVEWLVTGDDGHPVRGEYTFVVQPGAAGLMETPPATAAPTTGSGAPVAPAPEPATAGGFDVESPLYALVRWLTFVGLLVAIGTASFQALILPMVRRREERVSAEAAERVARSATDVGLLAAGVLALAVVLRLVAQAAALGALGGAAGGGRLGFMLTGTPWGWGWIVQAGAVLLLLAGWGAARRGVDGGRAVAVVGVLALAFTPALSGHAAAASAAAVVADALHVLAAGAWLGTLLLVIAVGIPVLRAAGLAAAPAAAAFLRAFSPVALAFAGLLVLTGVYAAWLHLGSLETLFTSSYGKVLLLKLAVLSLIFAAGAYNWLLVQPSVGAAGGVARLQRSAGVELVVGLLVLAVTAVLVATPPPGEAQMAEAPPAAAPAALP